MSVPRALLRAGAALLFVTLAGATYQGVTTAVERHRFARPGGMVDVGGHQLHIVCMGTGTPAVILEAPAAGLSAAWARVQPRVARVTRACSYDRAGLGWSERGDGRYVPDESVGDFRALLLNSKEKGPYIIVGQGFGAALATLFAAEFPRETAALVLVDAPADPDRRAGHPLGDVGIATPWLARVGILRTVGRLPDRVAGLSQPSESVMRAFLNRPDHLTRSAAELSQWRQVVQLATGARVSAAIPQTRVDTGGLARVAFLTKDAEANSVVLAILDAVTLIRGQAGSTSPVP